MLKSKVNYDARLNPSNSYESPFKDSFEATKSQELESDLISPIHDDRPTLQRDRLDTYVSNVSKSKEVDYERSL